MDVEDDRQAKKVYKDSKKGNPEEIWNSLMLLRSL